MTNKIKDASGTTWKVINGRALAFRALDLEPDRVQYKYAWSSGDWSKFRGVNHKVSIWNWITGKSWMK